MPPSNPVGIFETLVDAMFTTAGRTFLHYGREAGPAGSFVGHLQYNRRVRFLNVAGGGEARDA